MIQMQTMLNVADNSGARKVRCIKVLGGSKRRYAASVTSSWPPCRSHARCERQEEGCRALRCRAHRQGGPSQGRSYIRFDDNAAVVINKDGSPVGTRIFGPVARELRDKKYMKIVSLAPETL